MKPWSGELDRYRVTEGPRGSSPEWGANGLFKIPRAGVVLLVIASDQGGWDHVSVTVRSHRGALVRRTPSWEELCYLKELFWEEEETVLQYHPPRSAYVNAHPYCLHLWRPQGATIPLPPRVMLA